MKAEKHADVWARIVEALEIHSMDFAGQSRRDIDLLILFASEIAIAYQQEADNARG